MEKLQPDYKKIYTDLIIKKFPQKMEKCQSLLQKQELDILDVIKLNNLIFETRSKECAMFNQMHRSYDEPAILKILDYQKKNKLNNSQLACHFKLSRNTVTKWQKLFLT